MRILKCEKNSLLSIQFLYNAADRHRSWEIPPAQQLNGMVVTLPVTCVLMNEVLIRIFIDFLCTVGGSAL